MQNDLSQKYKKYPEITGYKINFYGKITFKTAQVTIPSTRGNKNETALHLTLFVSLYIVSIVVEHGK